MNIIYLVISLCAGVSCDPTIQIFTEPEEVISELAAHDHVKVLRLTCNDHNCLTKVIHEKPKPKQKSFEQIADEVMEKTNAEFCEKATEPWQKKAFCK